MNVLRSFSDAIATKRKHSTDKQQFFAAILRSAKDGVFTDEEVEHLREGYKKLNLSPADLNKVAVQAYNAAIQAVLAKGTAAPEDEANLDRVQQILMIPDAAIARSKSALYRLRVLTEIKNGHLPSVVVPNVVLQKTETSYWAEPGSLIEERVVNRRYEGASQGVSVRIAKGVSYRIGAQRGHLVTDTAKIPVSSGSLIVTNKRLIFAGDAKSVSLRLNKLLGIHFYSDGVGFSEENGKSRLIKFGNSDNGEIVAAILSRAINDFSG